MFPGGICGAEGAHFVQVESGLFGSDVLVCPREFREPRGAGGRTGSQFLLAFQSGSGQLLPAELWVVQGPRDTDFGSPKCSGAWGGVVVHVQEPGPLGVLCAPS